MVPRHLWHLRVCQVMGPAKPNPCNEQKGTHQELHESILRTHKKAIVLALSLSFSHFLSLPLTPQVKEVKIRATTTEENRDKEKYSRRGLGAPQLKQNHESRKVHLAHRSTANVLSNELKHMWK